MILVRSIAFGFLIIIIVSWIFGWEFIYRPIQAGPVISPYTSTEFIVLFIVQAMEQNILQDVNFKNYLKKVSISFAFSLLLFEFFYHFLIGRQTLLGYPISSNPTLIMIASFFCYETLKIYKRKMTIFADMALLTAFIWIYLSIVGHIMGFFYLTGAIGNPDLGLSIPTAILGLLYIGIVIYENKILVSTNLYKSVPWVRRIIIFSLPIFLLAPVAIIVLLETYFELTNENEILLFYTVSVFQFIIGAFYVLLLIQISDTHSKIETICSYTHKFRMANGKWVPLEHFLYETYGIQISHGISEEAESKMYEDTGMNEYPKQESNN